MTRGFHLPVGPHVVTALADGYEPYQDGITVEKNTSKSLTIALKPLGSGSSVLEIYCYPQSRIYIDGISEGYTPKTIALLEGKHFLILQRDGYESYSEPVTVTPQKATQIQVRLEKQQSP